MGAVDPGAIHAPLEKAPHIGVIGRGLRGKRHHEAGPAVLRRGSQQAIGVTREQLFLQRHLPGCFSHGAAIGQLSRDALKGVNDGIETGQRMALAAPQGRQAHRGEPALEIAQVMAAQGHVGGKIGGAGQEPAVDDAGPPALHERLLGRHHLRVQGFQFREQHLRGGVGAFAGHVRGRRQGECGFSQRGPASPRPAATRPSTLSRGFSIPAPLP